MHFKLKTLLRRSVNCVLVVCVMLMSLWPAVAAYAAAEAGKAASVNVSRQIRPLKIVSSRR